MKLRAIFPSTTALALLFGATAAAGAVVPFSPLPTGAMTLIPKHAPTHVGFGERVQGLFVAQAPVPKSSPGYKRFQILDSKREASEFASKGYVASKTGGVLDSKSCVFFTDEQSVPGDHWPSLARGELSSFPGSDQKPVVGVHVETLEDGSGQQPPALGIVDAWLDTRTSGMKLIAKGTIPLSAVGEGPFGIRVFAARGDDSVHFIVLPPASRPDDPPTFGSKFERAIIESGGEVGVSQCLHSRISLRALPGNGERAIISYQHVERAPREAGDPAPSTDDARESFATTRVRLVQVHLSASRNSGGSNAPVVSVSFRIDKPKPIGS